MTPFKRHILRFGAAFSTLLLLCAVAFFLGHIIVKGAPALSLSLIFGDVSPMDALLFKERVFDGLFPAICGTACLVILAVTLSLPLGVLTGIWLSHMAKGRWKALLSVAMDTLAGVPSIVVGLFGFSAAIMLHRATHGKVGPSLLISAATLGVLVLPGITRNTQLALEAISQETRLVAMAMGASRVQAIFRVYLPMASPGIFRGAILALGRCAEDTAAIMLTGVVATAGSPYAIFGKYEALPFAIFTIASEYSGPHELARGYSAALILLVLCVLLFGLSALLARRFHPLQS